MTQVVFILVATLIGGDVRFDVPDLLVYALALSCPRSMLAGTVLRCGVQRTLSRQ
jgi:hypothetical protein